MGGSRSFAVPTHHSASNRLSEPRNTAQKQETMNAHAGGPASRWNLKSKTALAVAGGVGLTLVIAGPALAHDNAVTAVVVCNVNYEWEVQWSVANDYGQDEVVLASSDTSLFDVGDRIEAYATVTQTEVVAGPIDKTLTVTAKWDDGWPNAAGLARSGSISTSDFQGTCAAPLVASASVTTTDETCDSGEILNYGPSENSVYSGTPDGTVGPGPYNVISTATGTATFPTGSGVSLDGMTKTFTGTLSGPLDPDTPECRKPATPVGPTVIQGQCVANKVVPGSATTFAELVALQPAGVVATLDAGSTTEGTFAAASGYYLTPGSLTTFSLKLDPDPTAADCTPPCTQHCTPPQPFTGDEVHANWFQAQLNAAWPLFIGGLISVGLVLLVVFWRPFTAAVRKLRRPRVTG